MPISICGKAPKGYTGLQYKKLAPKWEFFQEWKQNHNNDYYLKCFDEQVLAPLNPVSSAIGIVLPNGCVRGVTMFVNSCNECLYQQCCPVMWSLHNAACLTLAKQKKDDSEYCTNDDE